jgi:hypothetical protein
MGDPASGQAPPNEDDGANMNLVTRALGVCAVSVLGGCVEPSIDGDVDGVFFADDCDDADSTRWEAARVVEGNVAGDFGEVCGGACAARIEGDLNLSKATPTDLTSLTCLSVVGGDLIVKKSQALTNLIGLDGLVSVGGAVELAENTTLTDLSALDGLQSIGGDFVVEKNSALVGLSGLNSLRSVRGELIIAENTALGRRLGPRRPGERRRGDLHRREPPALRRLGL